MSIPHVLINPMDTATLPRPPRRLPILGDVIGIRLNTPVQSGLRMMSDLGPISARKVLGTEVVTVGGADLAGELADEARFCKFVGLHLPPLRRIVGDALFTAENDEPNWQLAHDILAPAFTREAMSGYHPSCSRWPGSCLAVGTPPPNGGS
jgi:cytochrome P450